MTTYKLKTLMLTLLIMWLGIFDLSPSYALTFSEVEKLLASDGAAGDRFSNELSISGNTVVIAAESDEDNGNRSGSAYVFVRDKAGVWHQQQKLTASDGMVGDLFGQSVSISGDTIVIGAIWDDDNGFNTGSAYVFVRDGAGVWSEQQKLTANDGEEQDWFGHSVSISGDTIVIGVQNDDDSGFDAGSAYVFVRDGAGTWSAQQKLLASDADAQDAFGKSVSISGDTTVIGAYTDDDNGSQSGSAYVFVRDNAGVWSEQQKLIANDGESQDRFGISVSISDDTTVIGAFRHTVNFNFDSGAAYVFVRDNLGVWSEQQKLAASDVAGGDHFGISVSISGDTTVIGVERDNVSAITDSGSAYVFVRDGTGGWSEQQKILANDGAEYDLFGSSVSVSGDTAVIGSLGDDDNGDLSGSAYVFEVRDIIVEKLINHSVREALGTAAQLLTGTHYRVDYKVTNNGPNRLYRVRVSEGGQFVCNLYALDPGQSKQTCTGNHTVLSGSNNVPAIVTAKVSGKNQELSNQSNAYYSGHDNLSGELSVAHFINDYSADTQAAAVDVYGNQADVLFRVQNTGSIELYRIKTYHDPVSPINSGWQQQCEIGTLMPGQVRYCKRTISVNQLGLNHAFGRAQGVNAFVSPTGVVNAANPSYFNVVIP